MRTTLKCVGRFHNQNHEEGERGRGYKRMRRRRRWLIVYNIYSYMKRTYILRTSVYAIGCIHILNTGGSRKTVAKENDIAVQK